MNGIKIILYYAMQLQMQIEPKCDFNEFTYIILKKKNICIIIDGLFVDKLWSSDKKKKKKKEIMIT